MYNFSMSELIYSDIAQKYNIKNYHIDDLSDENQKAIYDVASDMENKYNAKIIELKELIKKNVGS